MELRHLRYFVTLAERLHFLTAAEELGITQPALSSALKALEYEVGAMLIDRSKKKHIRLTPAGEVFFSGARQTIHASQRAMRNAAAVKEGRSGVLYIGHTDDFTTDVLPDLILGYEQVHPDVILNFQQGFSFHLPDLLRQGGVDLLLETYPLPQQMTNSATMLLHPTPILLVVPADHQLASQESVCVEQIMSERNLYIPAARRSAYEFAIERLFGGKGPWAHSKIMPTSTALQIELVRRARGVSLSTQGSFPQDIGGIKTVPIDHPDAQLSRVMVWREDNHNPALLHFLEFVREAWSVGSK
jgi:DNA-binding transcriptional LysR family regulator